MGRKVSQIQAVLARRCSSIGELQQHLLRAGWQRGVAQWGVLGEGGQWAAVAGFDGAMERDLEQLPQVTTPPRQASIRRFSSEIDQMSQQLPETPNEDGLRSPTMQRTISNLAELPEGQDEQKTAYYGHGNVFVDNTRNGVIFTDDPALAEWSIDAMLLIRNQLNRSGNAMVVLPFNENWSEYNKAKGIAEENMKINNSTEEGGQQRALPRWADIRMRPPDEGKVVGQEDDIPRWDVVVSNLPLLAAEVSELLNVMEEIMEIQRERRLEKFKPPRWAHRNWYITAVTTPPVCYLLFKMVRHGYGKMIAKLFAEKVATFFQEHVTDPLAAM